MAIGVHGLVMAHVVGHAEEVSSNGKENVTILRQNTEELNVLEIKSRQLPVKPATAHVILKYYLDKSYSNYTNFKSLFIVLTIV